MFNLEGSISEWRGQMLSAGVKNPEIVDELESHLREDWARRVQSGESEEQAFRRRPELSHAGPQEVTHETERKALPSVLVILLCPSVLLVHQAFKLLQSLRERFDFGLFFLFDPRNFLGLFVT